MHRIISSMRAARTWAPLLIAALSVLGLEARAQAADTARTKQAQSLFNEGVEAGKQEMWAQALDLFRRSQGIVDRPSTSFNIASALMHLDRYEEAVRAFEHFLAIADPDRDAELSRQANERIEDAKRILAVRNAPRTDTPLIEPKVEPQLEPQLEPKTEPKVRGETERDQKTAPATRPKPPRKRRQQREGLESGVTTIETEPEESSGSIFSSPVFWIVAGVVVVGAAVAAGVAIGSSGERDPYAGTSGTVLKGLGRW
jgi:tetratricopeptide (TPR) repeat protein